ncbi:MAG: 1-acyl-sn-glycerol-3-phosphate acyltransferase [Puniceicoccales bacterium]|jgi:1-acyl-sn-glycerol-3-phosphate acyltransferase|nr:1-acyl-sn-glycerol-3-phosphate acyltransferase [Puniceicoccales bacterium]
MFFLESLWNIMNPYYLMTILFCDLCFRELFGGQVYGQENIPVSGPFIVASNHLSHLDPPFIGAVFRRRELMFLARKTLFKSRFWNFLLSRINVIPVDKENSADISAVRMALSLLKNGFGITIFPEGTRSLDGHFGVAQPGIGFLACKSQAPVLPVRIFGTHKILKKYSTLPDIRQKSKIVIGEPLFPEQYDLFQSEKERYLLTANYILGRIKQIQEPRCKFCNVC